MPPLVTVQSISLAEPLAELWGSFYEVIIINCKYNTLVLCNYETEKLFPVGILSIFCMQTTWGLQNLAIKINQQVNVSECAFNSHRFNIASHFIKPKKLIY